MEEFISTCLQYNYTRCPHKGNMFLLFRLNNGGGFDGSYNLSAHASVAPSINSDTPRTPGRDLSAEYNLQRIINEPKNRKTNIENILKLNKRSETRMYNKCNSMETFNE